MGRTRTRLIRAASVALLTAVAGMAVAGPAAAQSSTEPEGLYGVQDPTYDGAFRQSLALIALAYVGVEDPLGAEWLVDQQCPDGGWTAYREDTSQPCPATNLGTFSGEDSNSTALATLALVAQGVEPEHDPRPFLKSLQNPEGGFGYLEGLPSDANSTALGLSAILALEEDPTGADWTAATGNPQSALLAMQLLCTAEEADRGAFEYQPGQGPNLLATVQAVPPLADAPLFLGDEGALADDEPVLDCSGTPATPTPAQAADLGGGWLARQINDQGFVAGPGGGANYSATMSAAIALSAAKVGGDAYDAALTYLAANVDAAVRDGDGNDLPGSLALLILAALGGDLDPADFGGEDLVGRLLDTQRAQEAPSEEPTPEPTGDTDGGAGPLTPDQPGEPLPDVVPTLVATGGFGEKPWDEVGVAVFGAGLIGYGLLALGGARWLTARGQRLR